ncbi:MAG: hypothetical protein RIQ53_1832, partial [Pseudomonadota bacterium]
MRSVSGVRAVCAAVQGLASVCGGQGRPARPAS